MGFRITTWNVNGIRNPFSYEPWRGKRTFESMFDVLEADIVVFQETKIQRKDLRDDMVLVPGWDCYFSLPRIKKGYSGVVIYTRNATCAPVRAEEGLTGVLCPPNSSTSFRDLPREQQIGGYPGMEQMSELELDMATIDSEGRCVILEFPAFVLLGVYCPANRDETRDCFRLNFLDMLDARIRNLVGIGKRVFVTGDLNISREEIDAAYAAEAIRKGAITEDEFVSVSARRLFNQLLADGKVVGRRDEGRENSVLHDICRSFHPGRKGMYTCWEQRINARPGNFGSRIDYVLCSLDMKDWFCESNIQEGLMGSDHCPVYAVIQDSIPINKTYVDIRDIMNPPGVFENGKRKKEYSTKYLLPLSGRLIPEFDKRRSIKDMLIRKPVGSLQKSVSSQSTLESSSTPDADLSPSSKQPTLNKATSNPSALVSGRNSSTTDYNNDDKNNNNNNARKRSERSDPAPSTPAKRSKSVATKPTSKTSIPGQQTLRGFFKAKEVSIRTSSHEDSEKPTGKSEPTSPEASGTGSTGSCSPSSKKPKAQPPPPAPGTSSSSSLTGLEVQDETNWSTPHFTARSSTVESETVIDPIASKENWSNLFSKKPAPKCEGHEEACISLTTKKPGMNRGRSFWICPRPLGPSGNKEKGTEWRCSTFIWASDWNSTT